MDRVHAVVAESECQHPTFCVPRCVPLCNVIGALWFGTRAGNHLSVVTTLNDYQQLISRLVSILAPWPADAALARQVVQFDPKAMDRCMRSAHEPEASKKVAVQPGRSLLRVLSSSSRGIPKPNHESSGSRRMRVRFCGCGQGLRAWIGRSACQGRYYSNWRVYPHFGMSVVSRQILRILKWMEFVSN